MSEIKVGVKDFKSHLSEYLRQVRQGHTVIITSHGQPVGRLLPVELDLEERLIAMQKAGLMTWNGQKLKRIKPVVQNQSKHQVADILVEMRE